MMYTVVRVTADPDKIPDLAVLGEAMNAIRPGTFVGMRSRGDEFGKLLRPVAQSWARATIDVAVEPEDGGSARPVVVLGWDYSLLADVAGAGLRLEVSVY